MECKKPRKAVYYSIQKLTINSEVIYANSTFKDRLVLEINGQFFGLQHLSVAFESSPYNVTMVTDYLEQHCFRASFIINCRCISYNIDLPSYFILLQEKFTGP